MTIARWSPRDMRLREWVLSHPGACKLIATRCKVSAEYVRLVLYGKRGNKKAAAGRGPARKKAVTSVKMQEITRELKREGAPL